MHLYSSVESAKKYCWNEMYSDTEVHKNLRWIANSAWKTSSEEFIAVRNKLKDFQQNLKF